MQVVILGDVHLGKNLSQGKSNIGANLNSRVVDQLNLLDWTLDQALDCGSYNIIITGDIFEDPKPPPYLITLFISWLKKCQINEVNVHIITGNHDILRSGSVYTSSLDILSEIELDNVSIYKDINTITIGLSSFTMLPFKDRKSLFVNSSLEAISILRDTLIYELASIPLTNNKFLIGHLAIEGSIPIGDEIDDMMNELFCPLDMFNGYDYVWMGHVHKPQILQKQNPLIAHIGSMDISNFGEKDNHKHIVIVNCNNKLNNDVWSTRNLPTRSLKKILISIPPNTEDSTTFVLDELKKTKLLNKSIVKVEILLESPELKSVNKSLIEKYLTSEGVFNISAISESKKSNLIKKSSNNIDTKMDVASAVKTYSQKYIEEKDRANFVKLATDIYDIFKFETKE